jgi:AcrR family transcriptional regulator
MKEDQKRYDILSQAEICFGEKGIYNTKLQDIASLLKISKKTIYKYFASKDELVKTVYTQKAITMNTEASSLAKNEKLTFVEKMIRVLALIKNELYYISPIVVSDLKASDSEIKGVITSYMEHAVFERFIGLLRQASNSGELKENVHIEATGLLYRDALMSFLLMHHQVNIPEHIKVNLRPVDILIRTLVTIFKGILTSESIKIFDEMLDERGIIKHGN